MTALRQRRPVTVILSETLDQACRKPCEAGTLTSAGLIASSFWSIATYWPCQYARAAVRVDALDIEHAPDNDGMGMALDDKAQPKPFEKPF
jgi:hypothetical protein